MARRRHRVTFSGDNDQANPLDYIELWADGLPNSYTAQYLDALKVDTQYIGPIGVSNIEVTITNMEGCGDWVFAEEKFYHFQAIYSHSDASDNATKYIDMAKIAFSDGFHWINASYDCSSEEFNLDNGSDVVNLKAGSVIESGTNMTVVFDIYFNNKILDALDVDIYMWCNDTAGNEDGWEIMASDYFNIYNLGGHATLSSSGDAGQLASGDVFDLYANTAGSWVCSNITYRNLAHIKLLPHVYVTNISGTPNFFLKYGMDFCTEEDDWVKGWWVKLQVAGFSTGSTRSVNCVASWYMGTTE